MQGVRALAERAREQWRNIFRCHAYPVAQFIPHAMRFAFDYRFRNGRACPPLSVSLMVTMRCDQACAMCKLADMLNLPSPDMPIELIERVARELSRARPLVMLSGGEPFLREDILDIVKTLNREGLSCGIFTNGLACNGEKIDELIGSGAPVRFVGFSLLGPPAVHDRIAGREGAFARLRDHATYFLSTRDRKKTTCFISATMSEENIDYLEEIVSISKKWGVDFVRLVHPCFLTEHELKKSDEVMRSLLPGEQIRPVTFAYEIAGTEELFRGRIRAIHGKYPGFVYFTPSIGADEIPLWYAAEFGVRRKCYFCWNSSFIYPNGDVCPCESFYYRLGNVNESSFLDIWNNEKYRRFRKILKGTILPGCARCCKL